MQLSNKANHYLKIKITNGIPGKKLFSSTYEYTFHDIIHTNIKPTMYTQLMDDNTIFTHDKLLFKYKICLILLIHVYSVQFRMLIKKWLHCT